MTSSSYSASASAAQSSLPRIERQIEERTRANFQTSINTLYRRTDFLFGLLLSIEWLAGIAVSLVISPLTWAGRESNVHLHVWMALILGSIIVSYPLFLIKTKPGESVTRHAVAIAQMLMSALLIHLTGGRIETHFHIFGSLAFLAFYRDWRVLISASLIVVADHILRGIYYPQSIYGTDLVQPWRWLEHAWWVIFEDIFLIFAIRGNTDDMFQAAAREAELETTRANIEQLVEVKTEQLYLSEKRTQAQFLVTARLSEADSIQDCGEEILRYIIGGILPDNTSVVASLEDTVQKRRFSVYRQGDTWKTLTPEQPEISKEMGANFVTHSFTSRDERGQLELLLPADCQLGEEDKNLVVSVCTKLSDFYDHRKAANERLHLAHLVQSSADAIIGVAKDGCIISWNQGAENLLGHKQEEVKGSKFSKLVPDYLREHHQLLFIEALAGQVSEQTDTRCLGADQEEKEVSLTFAPVHNDAKQIIGTSIIMRDISARKLAEKRVGEFYSMVSHELRTPLTSIRAVLGLIEEGVVEPDSDEAKELFQVARISTDRLIRLINDMLDLKKIEAGKMEMLFEDIEAGDLVNDCLRSLAGMAEEHKVNLVAEIEGHFVIYGDRDKTTQILTNLVSNAVKFSPENQSVIVRVRPTKGKTPSKTEMVRFEVADKGPGINEEGLSKLFEKFQQLDSSDSREKGGTGLGLAISKALVDKHNGDIGVYSTVGEGSTFWFEIPSSSIINEEFMQESADLESTVADLNEVRPLLLVEDDAQLASVLGLSLRQEGYDVSHASSLEEARKSLDRLEPAAILLDLHLPDGDGLGLIEEMRLRHPHMNSPVVVITGEAKPRGEQSDAAIIDWLHKPFNEGDLSAAIRRATKQTSGKRVLVVDDDYAIGKVLRTQMQKLGLRCRVARDGRKAISMVRAEKPDLIVLDVSLPGLDAYDILSQLRESEARSTPLIIYTGEELSSAKKKELTLGVTRYLTKQATSQETLVNTVKALLSEIKES